MGLSIRAYAQHRGVSHTAVTKAIKTGRISVEPDGKIDPAKADAQWARNTLPSQKMAPGPVSAVSSGFPVGFQLVSSGFPVETQAPLETRVDAPNQSSKFPVETQAPLETRADAPNQSSRFPVETQAPLETRAAAPNYQTSRAIREAYAARLAKLEFEERTGKLISKAEVDVKFFQLARQLRDRLQQIPRKIAPEIVALVVADPDVRGVADILEIAIREALEELSR